MERLRRIRQAGELLRFHRELLEALRRCPENSRAAVLLRWYEKPVRRAMADLRPSASPVLWLLTGNKKRARAYSAFHYLYDAMTLGLGPESENIL